jgi:hypothetical protein
VSHRVAELATGALERRPDCIPQPGRDLEIRISGLGTHHRIFVPMTITPSELHNSVREYIISSGSILLCRKRLFMYFPSELATKILVRAICGKHYLTIKSVCDRYLCDIDSPFGDPHKKAYLPPGSSVRRLIDLVFTKRRAGYVMIEIEGKFVRAGKYLDYPALPLFHPEARFNLYLQEYHDRYYIWSSRSANDMRKIWSPDPDYPHTGARLLGPLINPVADKYYGTSYQAPAKLTIRPESITDQQFTEFARNLVSLGTLLWSGPRDHISQYKHKFPDLSWQYGGE